MSKLIPVVQTACLSRLIYLLVFCCRYFRDVWNYQRRPAQNDLNMCKYYNFFASIQNSVVLKPKETTMLKSSNFSSVTVRTEAKVQYLTFCNCLWPEKPYSCFWFIQRTYSPLAQWSVPFAILEFTHHISSFYEWNLTLIPKLQPVGPNFSQNYYYSWQH